MSQALDFWRWFEANEPALFESATRLPEGVEDPVWQELAERMASMHPSLSYLVSDVRSDGSREFIITAGGNHRAVPALARLYREAPALTRWRVLRYRHRWVGDWDFAYEGKPLDQDGVEFVLFTRNQRPSLAVFVRGYNADREDAAWYLRAIPILVDHLLGEEDSMWLEEILVFPWEDPTTAQRYSVRLLPVAFDQMKQKLPAQPE